MHLTEGLRIVGKIKIVKHPFGKEHGQYIFIIDWFILHEAKVIFYRGK